MIACAILQRHRTLRVKQVSSGKDCPGVQGSVKQQIIKVHGQMLSSVMLTVVHETYDYVYFRDAESVFGGGCLFLYDKTTKLV